MLESSPIIAFAAATDLNRRECSPNGSWACPDRNGRATAARGQSRPRSSETRNGRSSPRA